MVVVSDNAEMTDPSAPVSSWWRRIDDWCERVGDALNPILVKETRQALKSRQFMVTFSVLLIAALSWTVVGSLSLMPQIYTSPSAQRMLVGYYIVLAIPMLMVVPLAAYRSLEGEIDDGTLELLSITALSPWQIVMGKLASAMLQMVLYYVALFPCVAYAYTLRGVDLPTTLLMMAILLVAAILLTVIAIFFAPISRGRSGRIASLLAVMLILLAAESAIGQVVISMIMYGNSLSVEWMFFLVTATLLVSLSFGHLLLTATAAMLTPESENRSTPIRLSLMMLTAVMVGVTALAIQLLGHDSVDILLSFAMAAAALWAVCGSMMVAESAVITPRIRRELPRSFIARAAMTWLTPGPVTGLVFASVNIVVLTTLTVFAIEYVLKRPSMFSAGRSVRMMTGLSIVYSAYLIGFLVVSRIIVGLIRIKNHPRVEVGLAGLIAVAVLSALVPYSIGLHWNDYRPFSYSSWQITNWVWTIVEVESGRNLSGQIITIVAFVCVIFFASLLLSPKLVFPRRTATPKRVKAAMVESK